MARVEDAGGYFIVFEGSERVGTFATCEHAEAVARRRRARVLAEYERVYGAAEWQPIATAPKDGTRVLLFCEFADGIEMVVARWVAPGSYPAGPFGPFVWQPTAAGERTAERVATHWQSLPDPPVST